MASNLNRIDARPKSVRELLDGVKYTIDYYQREYNWKTKQINDLLDDIGNKFLDNYKEEHERSQVRYYPHYFLGSIIISVHDGRKLIIDGQQRLTSITLLLIYLHNLQQGHTDQVDVRNLIYSEQYGSRSFNIDLPEQTECLKTLFSGNVPDPIETTQLISNIVARYTDIEKLFPDTLKGEALPYFIDWLKDNVDLVEITSDSDKEGYTIFETMNDRGLNLGPTDMLKGYLLSNIDDITERAKANKLWKERLIELTEFGKDEEATFLKAWLRAKYATSMRQSEPDASEKDFEKIGMAFHKWVKDEKRRIGLRRSADFRDFVFNRFDCFAKHYVIIRNASQELTPGLEYVFYNALNNFTMQYPLILAPIRVEDNQDIVNRKIRIVAGYIDIVIARRIVNFRPPMMGNSFHSEEMFKLIKEIRDLDLPTLAAKLKEKVLEMPETFAGVASFSLRSISPFRQSVLYLLARITNHIEKQSGTESSFVTYLSPDIFPRSFQIEHIWADHYEEHTDEFTTLDEFAKYRNRLGGLLLLPNRINQSLNDAPYDMRVRAYFGQNLLAKSLNEQCYRNNPPFMAYINRSGLPFRPHPTFKKADLDARQELYRLICEEIWSPSRFDKELD